jgi:glycosyltransferase involved in cell wall biosynthesis
MKITLLLPGTGSYYCGSCLRDHALATALGALGHAVEVVPLYLPLFLEEHAAGAAAPPPGRVRMGGINLYLQHKLPVLWALRWATGWLDRPDLLRWAAQRGDMTDAAGHASMALSMLRGEAGRQRREVVRLARELERDGRPDVFLLSNALLIGLARTLKQRLGVPLVCTLQGEAPYLDSFPAPLREQAWATLAARAGDVDAFIGVSQAYADLMRARLGLAAERVHVVHNGIALDGLAGDGPPPVQTGGPLTVGYVARLCPDKGLHTLVEAFCLLAAGGRLRGLRLRAAGALLERDRAWLAGLDERLTRLGLDHRFQPNVGRAEKIELLRSCSVLSVPATYGESFGLYVLEALAAGVPVVEPRHGAFPEILAATGGGVLCEPDDPASLARELEALLLDPPRRAALGARGQAAVRQRFTSAHMARGVERVLEVVTGQVGSTNRPERRSSSDETLSPQ